MKQLTLFEEQRITEKEAIEEVRKSLLAFPQRYQLFDNEKVIQKILLIPQSDPLCQKIALALSNFNQLDLTRKYHLAFSGGKDSHALLIIYLLWKQIYNKEIDLTIMFSDTRLESNSLYQIIENIEVFLNGKEKFERVYPENNYWYYQFVIGYPVPDWKNRWCTQKLKISPMSKSETIAITGRHFGESEARDLRLKTDNCSSGECGIDKIKSSYDPIIHFRNCDVWDLIFYADNTILYQGVFNQLKATYSQSTNEQGSLRMGCFMCPVVSINTLKRDNERLDSIPIRQTLEKLRNSRRINNPNKKKREVC